MNKIGLTIRKIRELKNYTQSYMSEHLNMSLSGYSKIERDESEVSVNRLIQIAVILDVDIQSILNFNQNTFFSSDSRNNSKIVLSNNNLSEKLISQLQSENEFLRNLIKTQQNNL